MSLHTVPLDLFDKAKTKFFVQIFPHAFLITFLYNFLHIVCLHPWICMNLFSLDVNYKKPPNSNNNTCMYMYIKYSETCIFNMIILHFNWMYTFTMHWFLYHNTYLSVILLYVQSDSLGDILVEKIKHQLSNVITYKFEYQNIKCWTQRINELIKAKMFPCIPR